MLRADFSSRNFRDAEMFFRAVSERVFLRNRPQWTDSQHMIVVRFLFLVVSCAVIKEPQNTPQRL